MRYSVQSVLRALRSAGDPRNVEGMARFGITSAKAYGVPAPFIHSLARKIGCDHKLAQRLWSTGILEARGLAALIGDPAKVTVGMMNRWVKDFDNWAVCDGACCNLFDKTPFAGAMALKWTRHNKEFIKRAGYVLMAALAVHDKTAPDENFLKFLPVIKRGSTDERNFVRKAVNWALRQIGKRNLNLNVAARKAALEIRSIGTSTARWIASDALRELESPTVQRRLKQKARTTLHAR